MAAVLGFDESDVRVGGDGGAGGVDQANERIVAGVEDERGNGDAVEHAGGGGAVVVVVRGPEAGVERGDAVVEFAQGVDAGRALRIEDVRKEHGLAAEAIAAARAGIAARRSGSAMCEGVGGGLQVDGGRDADDAAQLRRERSGRVRRRASA